MDQVTEFLILPDGTILVHNLTPTMAGLLSGLDPQDEAMRRRANSHAKTTVLQNHLELPL